LFNIENPSLYITIGDNLISLNSITNLTYGNNYQLSCFARNSRPSVSLEIFANGINLNSYSASTVSVIQTYSQCESNSICSTGLFLSLTLNDPTMVSIKTITCNALNVTSPFNLNVSLVTNIQITIPDTMIGFSSNILQIAFTSGTTATLLCFSNDKSAFWLFSPDGVQKFLIDSNNPTFYTIDSLNTLKLININQNNNGIYACGYSLPITSFTAYITYNLFVQGNFK
jgi:hypothetical protein